MSTDARVGTQFAGYRIESVLGRGGMGVVYLAEQEFPRRKVALKLLAPELAQDGSFRERFVRESNIAASIDHPNIVPIYGAGEVDGELYIAMRYVGGTDLRTVLDEEGPLDPTRVGSILTQVASALDAAHALGLVHRDVKPSNILLAKAGGSGPIEHVYVSDFGLTRRQGGRELTRSGQVVGSVDYIAPEQIEGRPVDARTDVYSLGCVLYECLTGEVPFLGEMDAAVLWAHVHDRPPKATEKRPELPEGIDGVIARAMAKDPQVRYPSSGDLAAAVRAEVGAPETRIVSLPRRRRARTLALVAVGVALAVGGFLLARVGPTAKPGAGLTGCLMTGLGGLRDKSYNYGAYQGLVKAADDLGITASARQSKSTRDYPPTLRQFVAQGCALIVTIGVDQVGPTVRAAKANRDQRFAAVDELIKPPLPNVLSLQFRVDQAAFLAGYLAAGTTRTGVVGAFGGFPIPTVVQYLDGFAAGILDYNRDHGTNVRLAGWNPTTGHGLFVRNFVDPAAGKPAAERLIDKGADIILPVAGAAGVGAAEAAREAGGVLLIGVDTDQFLSAPQFGDLWLTSVRKRFDVAVETAMKRVVDGTFKGGVYTGTLQNGGVNLAPFHKLTGRVPEAMRRNLAELRSGIIDGTVSVSPEDYA